VLEVWHTTNCDVFIYLVRSGLERTKSVSSALHLKLSYINELLAINLIIYINILVELRHTISLKKKLNA
jgi:hypothetical protein